MYLFQPNTNHAEGTRPYLHKSMKQFITLICAGLLMNSCATIFCGSKTKVTFDGEISEKATLTIDGMTCSNCSRRVENALNSLDGVWAKVDLGERKADVRLKQAPDNDALRHAVQDVGYTVLSIQ